MTEKTQPQPQQPPPETEEELKKRLMQSDFALGLNTKHLRLPGGLQRTDKT